jgi:hypothetical protein
MRIGPFIVGGRNPSSEKMRARAGQAWREHMKMLDEAYALDDRITRGRAYQDDLRRRMGISKRPTVSRAASSAVSESAPAIGRKAFSFMTQGGYRLGAIGAGVGALSALSSGDYRGMPSRVFMGAAAGRLGLAAYRKLSPAIDAGRSVSDFTRASGGGFWDQARGFMSGGRAAYTPNEREAGVIRALKRGGMEYTPKGGPNAGKLIKQSLRKNLLQTKGQVVDGATTILRKGFMGQGGMIGAALAAGTIVLGSKALSSNRPFNPIRGMHGRSRMMY